VLEFIALAKALGRDPVEMFSVLVEAVSLIERIAAATAVRLSRGFIGSVLYTFLHQNICCHSP
jgi:hypothetical protein